MLLFDQVLKTSKKQVLVLVSFAPMTKASKKDKMVLEMIFCIYYLLCFCKEKKVKIRALINSGSEANAMTPAYALKLGLKIRFTNIEAQKINSSIFKIFRIILASF